MTSEAIYLIPYALLATLSPLGLAATIAVMRSGRLTAVGFAIGVVVGQVVACSFLVAVGAVITPDRSKAHSTLDSLLRLAVAITLLAYASVLHRRPVTPPKAGSRYGSGRSQAALERLQRVRVRTAAGVGVLLGIGGPKRLVLTALAAASIATAGATGYARAGLIGWYCLLATALVWLPVGAYVIFGSRTMAAMDAASAWLSEHRRQATVYTLVIVGLGLGVSAVALLV